MALIRQKNIFCAENSILRYNTVGVDEENIDIEKRIRDCITVIRT